MHRKGWSVNLFIPGLRVETQRVLQIGMCLDIDLIVAQSAGFLLDHADQSRRDSVTVTVLRNVKLLQFRAALEPLEDVETAAAKDSALSIDRNDVLSGVTESRKGERHERKYHLQENTAIR